MASFCVTLGLAALAELKFMTYRQTDRQDDSIYCAKHHMVKIVHHTLKVNHTNL